jgi:hypothetical protein
MPKPGAQIALVLRDNVFWPKDIDPDTTPKRGPMRDLIVNNKFLELLAAVRGAGGYVTNSPAGPRTYAPKVFAHHPNHGDITEKEFERAIDRLLGMQIEYREEKLGRTWYRNLAPKDAPQPYSLRNLEIQP